MFENTINMLKSQGLILQDDIVVVCMESTASAGFWFGAIGAAIAAAKAKYYIISANQNEIRVFDLNKKTGEYLGTFFVINKSEIQKAVFSGLFGSFNFSFKSNSVNFKYQANNRFGINQKEQLLPPKGLHQVQLLIKHLSRENNLSG